MLRRYHKLVMLVKMNSRNEKTIILALLGVGLVSRLAYFFEYKKMLEFLYPTVDALFHHLTATAIASGALTSSEPFFRAPFYSYFLGCIYFLTGDSIAFARFLQLLIGVFTPVLTYLIAKKAFDRTVATAAAVLMLLCRDIVYFEGELLLESLVVTLTLVTWYAYVRYRENRGRLWLSLCGLATGLAVITRPNAAILALVIVVLLWVERERDGRAKLFPRLGLYVAILAVPVVIVLAHNLTRPQPAFAIATQGGINFYLGNNKAADGVSAAMPDKLGSEWLYDDIKFEAERATDRTLKPTEVSDYYYRLALTDIKSNLGRWLALELKKTYLIFSGSDISNNRNLIAFRSQFASLKLLMIGMAVLAPLGLIGMIFAYRRSHLVKGLMAFAVLYALSFVFYFVNSRFRLPVLPILAMFAAFASVEIYRRIREKSFAQAAYIAAPAICLAVILNNNWYRLDFDNRQQQMFSKGNLYLSMADYPAALDSYFQALDDDQPLKQVYLNIGVAHLQLGEPDSAAFYFEREDSLFNGSAEALNNLAYLARRRHEYPQAAAYARQALAQKPYLEEARLNLAYAMREAGFADSAYRQLKEYGAERLTLRERFLLGAVASDLGRYSEAVEILRSVLQDTERRTQPLYAEASGTPSLRLDLNPQVRPAKVFYNLGYALGATGQIDSAIVYLTQAVAADPNMQEALINLGSAYFAKRDIPAAKDALLRAARINSKNSTLMYNLALVSLASNDTAEATGYLKRSLEIDPELLPAKMLAERMGWK